MPDMGLSDFELDIRSHINGFRYIVTFRLEVTHRMYTASGVEPTPNQCFDMAMGYLAQTVREGMVADV
jgi:hypothetical protein